MVNNAVGAWNNNGAISDACHMGVIIHMKCTDSSTCPSYFLINIYLMKKKKSTKKKSKLDLVEIVCSDVLDL